MNILFASPEVAPFVKTGGLGDVSGSLPRALSSLSCNITVIAPFYRDIKNKKLDLTPFSVGHFNFLKYKKDKIHYVFVVNDPYYDRPYLYNEPEGDYADNYLRFSYFCKAIVALATDPRLKPDIIHCNDWQTGLVPVYLKLGAHEIKTLFTIHNIGYQGLFGAETLEQMDIPNEFYHKEALEFYGRVSFLKAGIVYSSAISTVSKKYSEEITTPQFGCGMDGILRTRRGRIYGILNGVDYAEWDPETDRYLRFHYSADDIAPKEECKKDLREHLGMPQVFIKRPLIGVISRLARQKGIDLVVKSAGNIIKLGADLVILGIGDKTYNNLCMKIAVKYPRHVSVNVKFDNALAHKIEAGCDMFLMPSRYEPCGLNQLYSLRYGTLPIVRATGGLDDTIIDLSLDRINGNGVKFTAVSKKDMLGAIKRALRFYKKKKEWRQTLKRIMQLDFSWENSAARYLELYRHIMNIGEARV